MLQLTRLAYSPMTDCSHFLSKSEVSSQLHHAKAYCHRARVTEQNTSNGKTLQPGQYVHQKRIMQRYFYTFILLQCQASDRANKNYSVRAVSCQVGLEGCCLQKRQFCHNFEVVCQVRIRQNSTRCYTLEL